MQPVPVRVLKGRGMAAYGFGEGHPFGADRHDVFHAALEECGLAAQVVCEDAGAATPDELTAFHTPAHVARVAQLCREGCGFLDAGDTPARPGIDRAAAAVVGAGIHAMSRIIAGDCQRAFVPIAGLHHARRDRAAGFCVHNDCGVVIELLRRRHGLSRIAYVDIDAHHGDGVFYAFEDDPGVIVADIHEDGRCLYPGTGHADERGRGAALGTKCNLPLAPGSGDEAFAGAWQQVEAFLDAHAPEFFILQCGADSLGGDPIAHLRLTAASHRRAAEGLCRLAGRHARGRLLVLGGGGYDRGNLAAAWTAVVGALVAAH